MIKLFITVVSILSPIFVLYMNYTHPSIKGGYFFSLLILLIGIEKVWETFFTSKEKEVKKYHGDWTLLVTSAMYFLSAVLVVAEFFYTEKKIIIPVFILGIFFYILAGVIRFWAIKTLGSQWAIHLVDKYMINSKPVLIKRGPYKYIRHPIYLGHFLELVGIALIFNAFYSLAFIFIVNLPLYIQRAFYEEKISLSRFSESYPLYRKETSFMFPIKLFKFNKNNKK